MRRLILFLAFLSVVAPAVPGQPHPSVTLAWSWSQGTGDPATGFHVQRSPTAGGPYTVVGTIPVDALTYLDTTVKVGQTYYYVVTAYNPGGDSDPSAEVSCTLPFLAPQKPSTVSASVK